MSGRELFDSLVRSTGLPEEFARTRLENLLSKAGIAVETLTIEQTREILSDFLLDVFSENTPSQI